MRKPVFDIKVWSVSGVLIVFLLAITCFVVLFTQWFFSNCFWWDCAPQRTFTVFDLNLPDEYFPVGIQVATLSPDRGIVDAVEEGVATTRWPSGVAIYRALKFATEKQAIKWFTGTTRSNIFFPGIVSSEQNLENQEILNHVLGNADEYVIECGYVKTDERCAFEARYQEFYIFFSGSIGENDISSEDFIDIMDFIDIKMAALLNNKQP